MWWTSSDGDRSNAGQTQVREAFNAVLRENAIIVVRLIIPYPLPPDPGEPAQATHLGE